MPMYNQRYGETLPYKQSGLKLWEYMEQVEGVLLERRQLANGGTDFVYRLAPPAEAAAAIATAAEMEAKRAMMASAKGAANTPLTAAWGDWAGVL